MPSSFTNRNAIRSRKIVAEISVALKSLGADSKLLEKVKRSQVDEIYTAAEGLRAPALLLGFIGSWGNRSITPAGFDPKRERLPFDGFIERAHLHSHHCTLYRGCVR